MQVSLSFGDLRARGIAAGVAPNDLPPAPYIMPHLSWVWRAWHRLKDERPWIGGGLSLPSPGKIPWSSVQRWAVFHGMSRNETMFLDKCLMEMEQVFHQHWNTFAKNQAVSTQNHEDKLSRWKPPSADQ